MGLFNFNKKPKVESVYGAQTKMTDKEKRVQVATNVANTKTKSRIEDDLNATISTLETNGADDSLINKLEQIREKFMMNDVTGATETQAKVDNMIAEIIQIVKQQAINESYVGISHYISTLNGLLKDRSSKDRAVYKNDKYCECFMNRERFDAEVKIQSARRKEKAAERNSLIDRYNATEDVAEQAELEAEIDQLGEEVEGLDNALASYRNKVKLLSKMTSTYETLAMNELSASLLKDVDFAAEFEQAYQVTKQNNLSDKETETYLAKLDQAANKAKAKGGLSIDGSLMDTDTTSKYSTAQPTEKKKTFTKS